MSDKVFYELGMDRVSWVGPDEEGFYTPTVWAKPLPERVKRRGLTRLQDIGCFILGHAYLPPEHGDPHCLRCGRLEHYR